MQVIERTIFYARPDKFTLHPIGDAHKGVIHCDEDLLEDECVDIKRDSHALWLGIGDYADLITPSDFKRWDGRILAKWMKGNEDNIGATQLDSVNEQFSPIWNKCLGLIEGNHEESIRKHGHYNLMTELLKKANHVKTYDYANGKEYAVPYGGVQCFVVLHFIRKGSREQHDYIIHARHGEGAARTSGARANAVLRMSQTTVNAQITLMGHLHGQESPDIPQRMIVRNGRIKSYESVATMTGAWIRAYMQDVPPCYLERWGSPPSVLGCPKIIIEPDKGKMTLEKSRKVMEL
jgi:hypothetical protein